MKTIKITAQRNVAAIEARQPAHLRARMNTELKAILAARATPHEKVARIWKLVELAFDGVQDNVACRRGCSHCCHIAVGVMTIEAELIGRRISRAPHAVPGREHFRDVRFGYDNPCTFLVDGQCSIYEHRPLACRVYFNVDVDALMCELTPNDADGAPVPQFDTHQYQFASMLAAGGSSVDNRLGDIREFFPPPGKG